MFTLSNVKSIRRSELDGQINDTNTNTNTDADADSNSSHRSASPDAETSALLQAKLASLYGPVHIEVDVDLHPDPDHAESIDTKPPTTTATAAINAKADQVQPFQGDSSYTFRLFTTHAKIPGDGDGAETPAAEAQQVILSPPSPPHGTAGSGPGSGAGLEGGFIVPRPLSWYHSSVPGVGGEVRARKRRLQFANACVAVSGLWVVRQSCRRNVGLQMPWRVKRVRVSRGEYVRLLGPSLGRDGADVGVGAGDAGDGYRVVEESAGERVRRKARPNKKRRIEIRGKQRSKVAAKMEGERMKLVREQEEREKKTRRNREKKVKKKAREKAKKQEVSLKGDPD